MIVPKARPHRGDRKSKDTRQNRDMIKQITLSELSDELAQTKTKKKEILNRIDRIVPWGEWLKIVEPHY